MKPRQGLLGRGQGVVLLEACVAIMLLAMVLGAVSLLTVRYAQSTDYFLNYRRAQLAAESCVERLRVGSLAAKDAAFTDAVGIGCEIEVRDAEGAWAPLRIVRVTSTIVGKHGRVARYVLTTYIAPAATGTEGR